MKHFFTLLCVLIALQLSVSAQTIINVPSDQTEGNLNNAIQAHINDLSNYIFMLEPYGYYVLSGGIIIPLNQTLRISAPDPGTTQATAPPQIVWTVDNAVTRDYMFQCFGDLSMKNVWVRYADAGGVQVGSQIRFWGDTLGTAQVRGTFENVIFDYSPAPSSGAGGSITVTANHFVGRFINCYWKNCIDTHLRYYGRAVSFPYNSTKWHTDSLYFENCTFANMGYVLMHEAPEYSDNVYFNHCTFFNVMMYSLEQGFWYKLACANSLFINAFMYGKRPIDGDAINGATVQITAVDSFTFNVPFTDAARRILFVNNAYGNEPWLVNFMANSPWAQYLHQQRRDDEIPEQQPMFNGETITFFDSVTTGGTKAYPYMNKANIYDYYNPSGFDPGFGSTITNMDSLKAFLNCKWDTNCDHNWAFQPDDGWFQTWPLTEDFSYTNTTLQTAGLGGYPLGDLYRWWPSQYTQWNTQSDAETQLIINAMETGDLTGITSVEPQPGNTIPTEYSLGQNYPNPFNPTTKIEYSIPAYSSHVTLKVFNLLGQEVATLFEGSQNAGSYVATFDASELSSGIYVYRLQTEGISISRKLILMK